MTMDLTNICETNREYLENVLDDFNGRWRDTPNGTVWEPPPTPKQLGMLF